MQVGSTNALLHAKEAWASCSVRESGCAVSTKQRFVEIYPRLAPVVYRRSLDLLGQAEEANDAVQEILLTIHSKLDTFRGDANLMTWVYRVATNHCLNRLRARRSYIWAAGV